MEGQLRQHRIGDERGAVVRVRITDAGRLALAG
jgi:hypothetical protein